MNKMESPPKKQQAIQEQKYRLPYHWFPKERLEKYTFEELRRILERLLIQYKPNQITSYLDIGCGDGRWTTEFQKMLGSTVNAFGVDFSKQAIGFARLINPTINFIIQDASKLDFENNCFDVVSSIEVIEHIDDEYEEKFVREIHRVLRPDGLLLLTTPSINLPVNKKHFRHYSPQRLSDLFTNNGFEVLNIVGHSLPLKRFLTRLQYYSTRFPFIWTLWKFSVGQCKPEKAVTLIVAARAKKGIYE